jgi:hypothetical protein
LRHDHKQLSKIFPFHFITSTYTAKLMPRLSFAVLVSSVMLLSLTGPSLFGNTFFLPSTAATTCPLPSNTVTVMTIGQIRSLPQSCSRPVTDKRGLENDPCCVVKVKSVTVLFVKTAHDGDWKFGITDLSKSSPGCPSHCLIAEIDPAYQIPHGSVAKPTKGSVITVVGYYFCDSPEATNPVHYNSCAEIHPVTSWSGE